jgi:hypothetical protein
MIFLFFNQVYKDQGNKVRMRDEEKRNRNWIKRMQDLPFCESDRSYHAKIKHDQIINDELESQMQKEYDDVLGSESERKKQLISGSYDLGEW